MVVTTFLGRNMMSNFLKYETKCRRCGKLHQWGFGKSYEQSTEENWLKLHRWVGEHMTFPCVNRCDYCNKGTLQDIVSYTDKGCGNSQDH